MSQKTAASSLDRMRAAGRVDRPAPSPAAAAPTAGKVRYSLLLDRELHREIRRYALDRDIDVSAIVRALFELLKEDPDLSRRVDGRALGRPFD